jgi:hypothetical protein
MLVQKANDLVCMLQNKGVDWMDSVSFTPAGMLTSIRIGWTDVSLRDDLLCKHASSHL